MSWYTISYLIHRKMNYLLRLPQGWIHNSQNILRASLRKGCYGYRLLSMIQFLFFCSFLCSFVPLGKRRKYGEIAKTDNAETICCAYFEWCFLKKYANFFTHLGKVVARSGKSDIHFWEIVRKYDDIAHFGSRKNSFWKYVEMKARTVRKSKRFWN